MKPTSQSVGLGPKRSIRSGSSAEEQGAAVPKITAQARSARRQDLIEAIWRLLARSGWRDLRVDDICAEAGASKGAFYGYFERKQDLLLALLEDEAAAMESLLADLRSEKTDAVQQLNRFAHAMLERAADPPGSSSAPTCGPPWPASRPPATASPTP
jgi:AcrR family transcriptional regulator